MDEHKNKKYAIVVIVYNDFPSEIEIASFRQCLSILKNHTICIAHPQKLTCMIYLDIAKEQQVGLVFVPFPDDYFKSIDDYNTLMLSPVFYSKFKNYDYILIYQLDAWVFRDELDYWCQQGYSYLGAPWFEGFQNAIKDSPMLKISGNGGFSLRHVQTFIELLTTAWHFTHFQLGRKLTQKSNISYLLYVLIKKRTVEDVFLASTAYEDWLYANFANCLYSKFKIAPPNIALAFSFEVNPNILYELNDKKLPFGCHAFEKYSPDFWKDKILFG